MVAQQLIQFRNNNYREFYNRTNVMYSSVFDVGCIGCEIDSSSIIANRWNEMLSIVAFGKMYQTNTTWRWFRYVNLSSDNAYWCASRIELVLRLSRVLCVCVCP